MNQDISICVGVVAKKNKIVFHSLNFQLKRLAYTTTETVNLSLSELTIYTHVFEKVLLIWIIYCRCEGEC